MFLRIFILEASGRESGLLFGNNGPVFGLLLPKLLSLHEQSDLLEVARVRKVPSVVIRGQVRVHCCGQGTFWGVYLPGASPQIYSVESRNTDVERPKGSWKLPSE